MVDHAPSFDARLPQAARWPLPLTESVGARTLLIAIALGFLLVFLLLPLIVVFTEALRLGLGSYWTAITEPEALAALRLTLLTALMVSCRSMRSSASRPPGRSPIPVRRQEPTDHTRRPAVLGITRDWRHGLCAAVRPARRVRTLACGARHQDHLRYSRCNHRDAIRDATLRRSRADPTNAKAGR